MNPDLHELIEALKSNIDFLKSIIGGGNVLWTKKQFEDEYRGYNYAIDLLHSKGNDCFPYVIPMLKTYAYGNIPEDVVEKNYKRGFETSITHIKQFFKSRHQRKKAVNADESNQLFDEHSHSGILSEKDLEILFKDITIGDKPAYYNEKEGHSFFNSSDKKKNIKKDKASDKRKLSRETYNSSMKNLLDPNNKLYSIEERRRFFPTFHSRKHIDYNRLLERIDYTKDLLRRISITCSPIFSKVFLYNIMTHV